MKDRIKQIRKETGLNQYDFATRLGLSRSHIAQVENGYGRASERTIRDICRIWGINEDWLKTGNGNMYCSKDKMMGTVFADIENGDEPFLESFLEVWISLDETSREALKRIAISMGEKLKERNT